MSHRNISSTDPRYNMRLSGSSYPSSSTSTQRQSTSQQGSTRDANGFHPPMESTDPYSPSFVSQDFSAQYLGNQAQLMSTDNGHAFGNTSPIPDMSLESYNGDGPSSRPRLGLNGGQHVSDSQTNGRFDHSSSGPLAPVRDYPDMVGAERVQESQRQPSGPSLSSPTAPRRTQRSLDTVTSTATPNERPQQSSSNARLKKIGTVYINEETRDLRYHCHVAGCANVTCGRGTELKRHWDSFHEDSIIWCPIRGCERSKAVGSNPFPKARKDKLNDHARNVHGAEFEF